VAMVHTQTDRQTDKANVRQL